LERFRVIQECKAAGCRVTILLTPVLPFLTDSMENMEEIYRLASSIGVDGISPWPLNLKGSTKHRFFSFLGDHFPELLPLYRKLYTSWYVEASYEQILREKVRCLRQKYDIPGISLPKLEMKRDVIQLSLF
jgi:DNA repair photolyase